jgi:hypothetical protein
MVWIDSRIIAVFQAYSTWIERKAGLSALWWARSVDYIGALAFPLAAMAINQWWFRTGLILMVAAFWISYLMLRPYVQAPLEYREWVYRSASQMGLPHLFRTKGNSVYRLSILAFSLVNWTILLDALQGKEKPTEFLVISSGCFAMGFGCMALHNYFEACFILPYPQSDE